MLATEFEALPMDNLNKRRSCNAMLSVNVEQKKSSEDATSDFYKDPVLTKEHLNKDLGGGNQAAKIMNLKIDKIRKLIEQFSHV